MRRYHRTDLLNYKARFLKEQNTTELERSFYDCNEDGKTDVVEVVHKNKFGYVESYEYHVFEKDGSQTVYFDGDINGYLERAENTLTAESGDYVRKVDEDNNGQWELVKLHKKVPQSPAVKHIETYIVDENKDGSFDRMETWTEYTDSLDFDVNEKRIDIPRSKLKDFLLGLA